MSRSVTAAVQSGRDTSTTTTSGSAAASGGSGVGTASHTQAQGPPAATVTATAAAGKTWSSVTGRSVMFDQERPPPAVGTTGMEHRLVVIVQACASVFTCIDLL